MCYNHRWGLRVMARLEELNALLKANKQMLENVNKQIVQIEKKETKQREDTENLVALNIQKQQVINSMNALNQEITKINGLQPEQ